MCRLPYEESVEGDAVIGRPHNAVGGMDGVTGVSMRGGLESLDERRAASGMDQRCEGTVPAGPGAFAIQA